MRDESERDGKPNARSLWTRFKNSLTGNKIAYLFSPLVDLNAEIVIRYSYSNDSRTRWETGHASWRIEFNSIQHLDSGTLFSIFFLLLLLFLFHTSKCIRIAGKKTIHEFKSIWRGEMFVVIAARWIWRSTKVNTEHKRGIDFHHKRSHVHFS